MIRSAANAIACRPDEQKRLMVTADACTGTPARRLAMRATFSPCSASGIAQPRITSSISSGVDAGRAPQRFADDGGRHLVGPDRAQGAVRRLADGGAGGGNDYRVVHEKSVEQVAQRVAHLARLPVEQMVGAIDLDQLLRVLQLRVELAHQLAAR